MTDNPDQQSIVPGAVRGPQLDKAQWPSFFDYQKSLEGESVFTPKAGFRLKVARPGLLASQGYGQGIASSTATIVVWDIVRFDNFKAYRLHTGLYMIPEDGLYSINTNILWAAVPWVVGNSIDVFIKNHSKGLILATRRETILSTAAYYWSQGVSCVAPLYKNEEIGIVVNQMNAGAKAIQADPGYNSFSIAKVGDI